MSGPINQGDVIEVWSVSRKVWFVGWIAEIAGPKHASMVEGSALVKFGKNLEKWVIPSDMQKVLRVHVPFEAPSDPLALPPCCLREIRRRYYVGTGAASSSSALPRALTQICTAAAATEAGVATLSWSTEDHIRVAVEEPFKRNCLDQHGGTSINDWLHHSLCLRHPAGPAMQSLIDDRLQRGGISARARLVRLWEGIDAEGNGFVACEDLLQASREFGLFTKGISEMDAKMMVRDMDGDDNGFASYTEFAARFLGLEYSAVCLYWYDLSMSWAKYLSPLLLGSWESGIWHTGITAFDVEFFYSDTICRSKPGLTPFGAPTKIQKLGLTPRTREELADHVTDVLNKKFGQNAYDVLDHNCNHFADRVADFLLSSGIPDEVRLQPQRVMGAPVARMLRPLLNHILGRVDVNPAHAVKGPVSPPRPPPQTSWVDQIFACGRPTLARKADLGGA